MTRSNALNLIRILADKTGCEYIEPDEDVLDMLVMFAELVEDRCADKLDISTADLLLMAGEMTSQELRTTKAVLACLARKMK